MGRNRRNTATEGIYDPNMTPLIDVSLVLVVILMVATPLAFQSSILLKSAGTEGRQGRSVAHSERIEIGVLGDGQVRVNRTLVPRAALGAQLGPLLQSSSTRLVVVRCEDNVPHGDFVSVIDEARILGAAEIAVVGH